MQYNVEKKSHYSITLCDCSWGTDWGINGYMKLARNQGNICGVATMASYPVGLTAVNTPPERRPKRISPPQKLNFPPFDGILHSTVSPTSASVTSVSLSSASRSVHTDITGFAAFPLLVIALAF